MQLTPLRPRRRRPIADSAPGSRTALAGASGDLSAVAKRIAGLIDGPVTEALVVMLTELYGDALARILGAIAQAPSGAQILDDLCDDRLVGGLLVVHDLHPHPLETRVERALATVSRQAALDRIEDDVVYVRLSGSAGPATRTAIARAVAAAAPEISRVCADVALEEAGSLHA